MRKVVVPVTIVAVAVAVGVWLSNRQATFDGVSSESLAAVQVPTPSPENRPVVQAESVEAVAASAGPTETGDSGMEPPAAPAATPAVVLEMVDQRGLKVLPIFRENEAAFALEPLDPLWSRSREAEILGQVAQMNGLRLLAIDVECRTSMCRLQLTQGAARTESVWRGVPGPAYTTLLANLGYEPRHPIGLFRDPAADTVTSLIYLPRLQAQ